jgi:NAD+-dependent protein deacetylase sirtuin 6
MSGGYASRLSDYTQKGVCGLPEHFDTPRTLAVKLNKLFKLIQESEKIVVLTGAGISTAAGISDFRGPKGVWTLENQEAEVATKVSTNGRKRRKTELSTVAAQSATCHTASSKLDNKSEPFLNVAPTYTHRALATLLQEEVVHYLITQNVDGLHLRSGIPRSHLSILHGDCFVEKCEDCGKEYFRDFDIGGLSFKKTGRFCNGDQVVDGSSVGCGGALRDTILDWEDELPETDFEKAEIMCDKADLVLALGTSLRILPAGQLPLKAKKYAIVNLQQTPYDQNADVVIHHYVDTVMESLCSKLGYILPHPP